MGKKQSVPNRQYTGEFKAKAAGLALPMGSNPAAKRLRIPEPTIANCNFRS